jgi:maltooligosyltrehalose trehalohydrolase
MKRRHDMPFGAAMLGNGRVRFRLWAPGARSVELCLSGREGERRVPMQAGDAGWYELEHAAEERARYCYLIDGKQRVPDPASRYNPLDVHGPSEILDPSRFEWSDGHWKGRPWHDAVIYEMHVGTFTPEGSFRAAEAKLHYLAQLGVTAVELMPLADFPGRRGWGYDGVLPYAPDASYGSPDELKRFIEAAHLAGLMVMLDVVYNHFGPEGNYLHVYAPQFFTDRHKTPWGAGLNYDGPESRPVRDFFIHNALYWLEEYHFDGLRFDAVHAIQDNSTPDILTEIAEAVHRGPGRERPIHLVLENDDNRARYLQRDEDGRPRRYTAQWNDDIHHCFHTLLTGESDGYYADYAREPMQKLGRCLADGFAYQGETSSFRGASPRGESTAGLPPGAFVDFLQNHDQIGNRAFGDRLAHLTDPQALAAATAILLLAPSPPLLFMGDEFAADSPFLFFCDFGPELARAVTEGRRKEFSRFEKFKDPKVAESIPDPGNIDTFLRSKLDWDSIARAPHSDLLSLYRSLLDLRRLEIVPLLPDIDRGSRSYRALGERSLEVRWDAGTRGALLLLANLSAQPQRIPAAPRGRLIYATESRPAGNDGSIELPAWSASWFLCET